MNAIRPSTFDSAVLAAVSTRQGGVSPAPLGMNLSFSVGDDPHNVTANRKRFFGELSISLHELAIPRQVHSTTILHASVPGSYDPCDGLFTDRRRLFLCVTVADCVPILIHAPDIRAVAAVHAGWRGTAGRIAVVAVETMVRDLSCDPAQMRVYLGPAAGACCYAVGEDVASQFHERFLVRQESTIRVDLRAAIAGQLAEVGVPPGNIDVSPYCTISESELFHSYRRDRDASGRMMGVIGLL